MNWEWRETLKRFVQTRPRAASERELVKCWEMEQSKYCGYGGKCGESLETESVRSPEHLRRMGFG